MKNLRLQAGCVFLMVLGVLFMPIVFMQVDNLVIKTVICLLYAVVVLPLSVEVMEIVLAFAWSEPRTAQVEHAPARRKTAVLMTVCNDWNLAAVAGLECLAAAGYDAFVLDDSRFPPPLALSNTALLRTITRTFATGAKAGNLNNWLRSFADDYEYAIILDSDSIMPVGTADLLVLAAEHPGNHRVALFQSKIRATASSSALAQALGTLAKPRMRILSRVHSQLGWLLSFGHNQLLRISAMRSFGGFDESFTNEDTVLSLELATENWEMRIVDAWSEDAEPEEFFQFRRRHLRWARQTLELFRENWNAAPVRLKMMLCRHLLSYLSPMASMALFLLSIWSWPWTLEQTRDFLSRTLRLKPEYGTGGELNWLGIGFVCLYLSLRFALSKLEGVSLGAQLRASLFLGIPSVLLIIPLGRALLTSLTSSPVEFIPTGYRHSRSDQSGFGSVLETAVSSLMILFLAAGVFVHPASLLVGLNAMWLAMIVLSLAGRLILFGVGTRPPVFEMERCE